MRIFMERNNPMTALLSNWVDECCQLMTPLNDTLYGYVMNSRKVHTDDASVKVLAPGRKKAKTGRIWTYVRDDRNAGSSGLVRLLTGQVGETPGATPPPFWGYPAGGCVHRLRSVVQS